MLKWLSRVDDRIVQGFQQVSNWVTKQTGIGGVNRKLEMFFMSLFYLCEIIGAKNKIMALIFLVMFMPISFVMLWRDRRMSEYGDGNEALSESMKKITQSILKKVRFFLFILILLDTWGAAINIYAGAMEVKGMILYSALQFNMLAMYFASCSSLPPGRGMLWEKIKDILTAKQPAVNQNGG
jgi:hypothetical protein